MDLINNATASSQLIGDLPENVTLCSISTKSITRFSHTFAFYINGPCLLLAALIGFVGNLLCLSAFGRSRRPPQINYYLIALSLWDLSLVISSFFLYNLPYLLYGRVITQGAYVLAYPFVYTLACVSHTGSVWAVIVSAVDRYFALCHPISHKIYSCARRTAFILAGEALLAILYNVPRYYELDVTNCYDRSISAYVPLVRGSRLRADPNYWFWYKVVGGLVFFSLGPLFLLTCLSFKVWSAVKQLTRLDLPIENKAILSQAPMGVKRRRLLMPTALMKQGSVVLVPVLMTANNNPMASNKKRVLRRHSTIGAVVQESQYTLNSMLLIVIVKFAVCHSLPTALDVSEALIPPDKFNTIFISNIVAMSNFLVICNSSINFFIYCMCSRRFRHDLASFVKRRLLGGLWSGCSSTGWRGGRRDSSRAGDQHVVCQYQTNGSIIQLRSNAPPLDYYRAAARRATIAVL